MKRKIQWLKWQDPLRWRESNDPEESGEQSTIDSFEGEGEEEHARHVRMLAGPYGLLPIGEHGLSSKLYKLWVGHTNFDITSAIATKISQVDGVEILRIWTRYRMWVGIANLFNTQDVQRSIERELCEEVQRAIPLPKPPPDVSQKQEAAVMLLEEKLISDYSDMEWIIYCDTDGSLTYTVGEDRQGLMERIWEKGLEANVLSKSW
jgi:hypothetical protein